MFWNALYAVYVLYITHELGLPPATIGVIFSVGAAGGTLSFVWLVFSPIRRLQHLEDRGK